jgi:hypothetical protein
VHAVVGVGRRTTRQMYALARDLAERERFELSMGQ